MVMAFLVECFTESWEVRVCMGIQGRADDAWYTRVMRYSVTPCYLGQIDTDSCRSFLEDYGCYPDECNGIVQVCLLLRSVVWVCVMLSFWVICWFGRRG